MAEHADTGHGGSRGLVRGYEQHFIAEVRRLAAMAKLDAPQVADLLLEIGRRAALEGGNPYSAKAYVRASESLRTLVTPLDQVIRRSQLRAIPGIGDAIARRILELRNKGTDEPLERLRTKFPTGLLELLNIPRLKPSAIVKLHKDLGIANLAEAEEAARQGRLRKLKGLGAAVERKILEGIAMMRGAEGRMRVNRAEELLMHAAETLEEEGISGVTIAGDLRRGCELIADLRLVATSNTSSKTGQERLGAVRVDVVAPNRFGSALLYATGNAEHLAQLEALARTRDLILGPDGIGKAGHQSIGRTEEAIYKRLRLSFIPPELREGKDEIAVAMAHALPELVEGKDLKGVLHIHTDFSDGTHTLREMAKAAHGLGYRYLGVTDHSKSAHYAGGLSIDKILRQHDLVDALNEEFGNRFRILKGIESDILADGSLDYPDEILQTFDVVVASVHSRFRTDKVEQTARIVRAVSNPFTTILGHITGRLLLRRPGYEVEMEPILKACASYGVAVEINSNPNRLELDWRWHRRALELGCLLSINPDAHSIRELGLVRWGVAIARKGGIAKEHVLNAMSFRQLMQHLKRRRVHTSRKVA
jgi:DNA polymerase (family 10)